MWKHFLEYGKQYTQWSYWSFWRPTPSSSESPCSTLSSYAAGGIPALLIREELGAFLVTKKMGGQRVWALHLKAVQSLAGWALMCPPFPNPLWGPLCLSHLLCVSQWSLLISPSRWIPPQGWLTSLSSCCPSQQPPHWSLLPPLSLQSAPHTTTRHIFHNVSQTRAPSVFYPQPSLGPLLPSGHSWFYFGPHRLAWADLWLPLHFSHASCIDHPAPAPHISPSRQPYEGWTLISFYRGGNCGSERQSHLPKIMQRGSDGVRIGIRASLYAKLIYFYPVV